MFQLQGEGPTTLSLTPPSDARKVDGENLIYDIFQFQPWAKEESQSCNFGVESIGVRFKGRNALLCIVSL